MTGGVLICLQPHRWKRPFIAMTAPGRRQPVGALINNAFEPLISSAEAAIRTLLDSRGLALIGTSDHRFRVRLRSLAELHRYLYQGRRPPRFPPAGRRRLQAMWRSRPAGARIEVTEFFSVIALRALER